MANTKQPRRHHYINQAYQKLFCLTNDKKQIFWVYDLERKCWRRSQPLNEGVEKDFQKLDHFIELDPYYLEKAFNEIEGPAVNIISKMTVNKSIPQSLEEFSPVINLMGLFAGRNIFVREKINEMKKQHSLDLLQSLHKDSNTYYTEIGGFLSDGPVGWPIFNTYEESRDFLNSKKFMIQVDPSMVVEEMAKLSAQLVDLFGSLNWMLLEGEDGEFITSNKPVNPIWAIGLAPYIPSFGLLNSIVTFPITPKFCLLGSWSPLPSYKKVDYFIVEGINWVTANSGATRLYAQKKSSLPMFEGISHLQDFHRLLFTRLIKK